MSVHKVVGTHGYEDGWTLQRLGLSGRWPTACYLRLFDFQRHRTPDQRDRRRIETLSNDFHFSKFILFCRAVVEPMRLHGRFLERHWSLDGTDGDDGIPSRFRTAVKRRTYEVSIRVDLLEPFLFAFFIMNLSFGCSMWFLWLMSMQSFKLRGGSRAAGALCEFKSGEPQSVVDAVLTSLDWTAEPGLSFDWSEIVCG